MGLLLINLTIHYICHLTVLFVFFYKYSSHAFTLNPYAQSLQMKSLYGKDATPCEQSLLNPTTFAFNSQHVDIIII